MSLETVKMALRTHEQDKWVQNNNNNNNNNNSDHGIPRGRL
jgi:hypothetical protein